MGLGKEKWFFKKIKEIWWSSLMVKLQNILFFYSYDGYI